MRKKVEQLLVVIGKIKPNCRNKNRRNFCRMDYFGPCYAKFRLIFGIPMKTIFYMITISFTSIVFTLPALALSLDQSQLIQTGVTGGIVSGENFQQEVTAGITGWLREVDLYVNSPGSYIFYINRGPAFQSSATHDVMFSVVGASNAKMTHDIDPTSFFLTAGEKFVIGIEGVNVVGPTFFATGNNEYSDGGLWRNGSELIGGLDLKFSTWVDPTPVPEPSTLLLLGSGLAVMYGIRRKVIPYFS